ncbi:AraC family transcriptional regulator [Emcibacter nanhaiensis]|uniref:Helix-turn-helix domain-containing protein n=1 Tax=Emcibacter nanhaiensis TaxID=1505037 RepID=A0A501PJQ8_9PROT|nr:AraC family transcriptional regulator [Emcibacter nanhaiensis]TPD60740.1 helix-turn-helix domain-containing protein [Emcibacter nanhaiensis]
MEILNNILSSSSSSLPFYGPPEQGGQGVETVRSFFHSYIPCLTIDTLQPQKQFTWRVDRAATDSVGTWRSRYSHDCAARMECEEDMLFILFPLVGAVELVSGGRETAVATPGKASLISVKNVEEVRLYSKEAYAHVSLQFNAGMVSRTLNSMFGQGSLSQLALEPNVDLSLPAGQTLKSLAETIVSGMYGAGVVRKSAQMSELLADSMLRLIFENVPHRLSGKLENNAAGIAPRHVKAAMDFMQANLHSPLSVSDIAQQVGVSVRSLQEGFRRFMDITPTSYLCQIRLEAVHAELSSAENRLPIYEVATKWGFSHLGRFSALYRKTYGRLPSETISQAHRSA